VRALLKHVENRQIIDMVLVNSAPISPWQAQKYEEQQAFPVEVDRRRLEEMGLEVIEGDFIDHSDLVRHQSIRLAEALLGILDSHK